MESFVVCFPFAICWVCSLSLGNRTSLVNRHLRYPKWNAVKAIQTGLTGMTMGAQLLPASRLDDSLARNNQKLGEMIENVSLKFSLVRTKIVLSPNRCWTKFCCLLSSCSLESVLHPSFFLGWTLLEHFTDKFAIYTDVHYRSVHLVKGSAFGQKACCSTLLVISLNACPGQPHVQQCGPVSVQEIIFSFMKRLLSFYLCNKDKILKNTRFLFV